MRLVAQYGGETRRQDVAAGQFRSTASPWGSYETIDGYLVELEIPEDGFVCEA